MKKRLTKDSQFSRKDSKILQNLCKPLVYILVNCFNNTPQDVFFQ